jgi:hypothetical protein
MDLRFEDEALGVHQQVPLSSFDLLAAVETPVLSAHRGALDRLGIHHSGAGLGVPFEAHPEAFSEGSVDPLPGTIDAPFPEVPVNGGPSREVMRK